MNNYASTTNYKGYTVSGVYVNSASDNIGRLHSGGIVSNSAVNSIVIQNSGGNLCIDCVICGKMQSKSRGSHFIQKIGCAGK
jgi:hypothetical protein